MINRVGGLAADADDHWLQAEVRVAGRAAAAGEQLASMINSDPFAGLTSGVAEITRSTIEQYGISGPAARASGVDLDLRLRQPYLAYGELAEVITPPGSAAGDAQSRLNVLAEEVITSASLIKSCVERLLDAPGPVSVKLGKIIRLPDGEAYVAIEAPLGIAGAFVVSRGEKSPWRLKLRTPSFSNVSGPGVDPGRRTRPSAGGDAVIDRLRRRRRRSLRLRVLSRAFRVLSLSKDRHGALRQAQGAWKPVSRRGGPPRSSAAPWRCRGSSGPPRSGASRRSTGPRRWASRPRSVPAR